MEPGEYDLLSIRAYGLAQQLVAEPEIVTKRTFGTWLIEVRFENKLVMNYRSGTPEATIRGLCADMEQLLKTNPEDRAKIIELAGKVAGINV